MNCNQCGSPIPEGNDRCEVCGTPVPQETDAPVIEKKENMLAGIFGALIGALIGGGVMVLLSTQGVIASISGLILAFCTLKGYTLLGKKLSAGGIAVCIALMLITPYLADRAAWALVIQNAYAGEGVTFGVAFAVVHELIRQGAIDAAIYWKDLLTIYAFTALGGVGTIISVLKKK